MKTSSKVCGRKEQSIKRFGIPNNPRAMGDLERDECLDFARSLDVVLNHTSKDADAPDLVTTGAKRLDFSMSRQ